MEGQGDTLLEFYTAEGESGGEWGEMKVAEGRLFKRSEQKLKGP